MTDETAQEQLHRVYGLNVETVGDIISEKDERPSPPPAFVLPVLEGYESPPFQPGIFFGMSDEDYHRIPALSNSGIKKLAASPLLFWASTRWLNENYEEQEQKDHFDHGHAYEARVLEGRDAFAERFAVKLDKRDYPNAVDTEKDIQAAMPAGLVAKGKTKAEKFAHLQTLVPDAQFWDYLVAENERQNAGKCLIDAKTYRQIEVAAAMIEKDEELGPIIRSGQPQVVLMWVCEKTGVRMKAKLDLMKIKMIVDMKTVQNSKEQSIENAIRFDIANRRYGLQPSTYTEGTREVRKLVRNHGASVIRSVDEASEEKRAERVAWAMKWASHTGPDEFLFIYQAKGDAPITRGLFWPRGGTTKMMCDDIVSMMKKRFRQFSEQFGTDMWLDRRAIYDLADEDLPSWATEI